MSNDDLKVNSTDLNDVLSCFNSFMLEQAAFNDYDQLVKGLLLQMDKLLKPIAIIFSEYDNDKNALSVKEVKAKKGILDLVIQTGGKKLLSTVTPVDDQMYQQITNERVALRYSISEMTAGAIPEIVSKAISKTFNIKCGLGFAFMLEDRLYGTMVALLNEIPQDYYLELLRTYAYFSALSLKRIKTDQALIENEEKYRQIAENISDVVWITDTELNTLYISPSVEKLIGESVDEQMSRSLEERLHPDSLNKLLQSFQEEMEKEKDPLSDKNRTRIIEVQHYKADGSVIWVSMNISFLRDNTGNITGLQGITRDISERKQAEAKLAESETKYRQLVENTHDIIYSITPEGQFSYVSPAWTILIGHPVAEIEGRSFTEFVHPGDHPACFAFLQKVVETGQRQEGVEYRVQHISGEWRWHTSSATPTKNKSGLVTGYDGIAKDITERKKTEEALKLQASERAAVDAFTYSVSHDLQAPLRRIEGFSEALLEECPDQLSAKALDYLERITRQIRSMKDLTDALLQLSRVVSHSIENEEVNLSNLIRSHLEKLHYAEPARLVETIVAPEMIAIGDDDLLSVVLKNLLENAWKYTAVVKNARIECGSAEVDGHTIYFVRDNGVGFDQQHSARLFTPFQKLHSETDYPGIGIGLNIAYRIITRHGGEIWAEGEPGKGACFYFTLP